MTKRIKSKVVNGVLVTVMVVLGIVIACMLRNRGVFSSGAEKKSLIAQNGEDIKKNIYDGKSKLNTPSDVFGGMWKGFDEKRSMIMIVPSGDKISIYNIKEKRLDEYDKKKYMDYINKTKNFVVFSTLRYDIHNFLRNALKEVKQGEGESPVIHGCLILPNNDNGLKFLSKAKAMDASCMWKDVLEYIYPSPRNLGELGAK